METKGRGICAQSVDTLSSVKLQRRKKITYTKSIVLKNCFVCTIRNGSLSDGQEVFEVFNQTHSETDFLLSYPDENSYDPQQEEAFLQKVADSTHGIEFLAVVDGRIVT